MGILTVAVVTKPFYFEGVNRMQAAKSRHRRAGAARRFAVIVILNKLMEVLGEDVTVEEAFKRRRQRAARARWRASPKSSTCRGLINVDFQDVQHGDAGKGHGDDGFGDRLPGMDRARIAAEQAIACPLLEGVIPDGRARRAGQHHRRQVRPETARDQGGDGDDPSFAAEEATVILGAVFDENMGTNCV